MRRKNIFIMLLISLLAAQQVLAQDKRPAPVAMNGVGTHNCGQYLEYKRTNNETMRMLYQQWAAGFLAGYSTATAKPGKTINLAADLDTYSAWLDKWCADEPLSNVFSGVDAMKSKLQKN